MRMVQQELLKLSKFWLIKPTFWPQLFPNVISNLISLLTLSISPFNNFSPGLWLWDTLFHFYNALVVTIWQNFSINWITLKADLKKKMCQPKKIGLSIPQKCLCFHRHIFYPLWSKHFSEGRRWKKFSSSSGIWVYNELHCSFIWWLLSMSVTFWTCKWQEQSIPLKFQ